MKAIHSPGVIPTFAIGFNSPLSDLTNLDTWRGIPGSVGFPNRFTFIDEASPDDSDYISQGLGNASSIYECDCGPPPVAAAGRIVASWRVRRMGGSGVWSCFLDIYRGGTLVHTETITPVNPNLPLTFTTFAISLSGAEIATLFGAAGNVQMDVQGAGGPQVPGASDAFECSWMHVDYFA